MGPAKGRPQAWGAADRKIFIIGRDLLGLAAGSPRKTGFAGGSPWTFFSWLWIAAENGSGLGGKFVVSAV